MSPVVAAELVSGATTDQERGALEDLLTDLPLHETPLAHWFRVGALRRQLHRRGLSISTPDAHVAQCALDRDALLLTEDAVFRSMAPIVSLRVASGSVPL